MTKQTEQYLKSAVRNLHDAGFESVDLFAPRGLPLSDGEDIIRQRCDRDATEAQLFAEAIKSTGRAFIKDIDFVLLMRADTLLWRDSKLFMEHTIEPSFVSVYFPVTPYPFFLASEYHLPCSGKLGWCEVKVQEPVAGATCLALNKHSIALLSGWISKLVEETGPQLGWELHVATMVQDFDLPCYAASRSFGRRQGDSEWEQQTLISWDARLKDEFKNRNLYLN